MHPQPSRNIHGDEDDARAFLKTGANVRKSAEEDAEEAYEEMMAGGKWP